MNVRCKCTTFSCDADPRRKRLAAPGWLGALTLAVSLLAGVPVAWADVELGHAGLTGRHRLADMYDSPGAVCDVVLPGFDSLGETWLRVNPPVIFARDRTAELDEQRVSWRATVSVLNETTGAWRVVRRADPAYALASDNLATYFDGQGWLAEFPLSRATYSVIVEMLWYDPFDTNRIEGTATHAIDHFMVVLRHEGETKRGRTSSRCSFPR
jgi:hypothetical protein